MKQEAKPAGRQGAPKGVIARKIERLRTGQPLRVLDLFSGCGGISLGFQGAGYQIDAAVELDELAAATHARNFHAKPMPVSAAPSFVR
jgi:DNA (cytosine-5)-methyltransferase 1